MSPLDRTGGRDLAGSRDCANSRDLAGERALSGSLPRRIAAEHPAVMVIGDVMLDGWWSGSIERLCREAPAPVVDITTRDFAPGGAANTAMNLAALGARVSVAGIIGTDDAGVVLREKLVEAGIDVRHLHSHPAMVTTTKIRISSGGQVLLRIDDCAKAVPEEALAALAASVGAAVGHQDAVMVCDYGTGVLADPVRGSLVEALARPELERQEPHAPEPEVAAQAGAAGTLGTRPLTVIDAHDPACGPGCVPTWPPPTRRKPRGCLACACRRVLNGSTR